MDFRIPIIEYFIVLKRNEFIYEWCFPLALTTSLYFLCNDYINTEFVKFFISTTISLIAILLGFTIAAIAIFTTANQDRTPVLKVESERKILGKSITYFTLIYMNFVFSIISGTAILMMTILNLFLLSSVNINNPYMVKIVFIIFFLIVFGILQNILLSLRNITSLYLIFRVEVRKKVSEPSDIQ
ncbi:MAG: hypothetical protein H7844_13025 [Nitrospirae bacterium YQR-1]